MRIWPLSIIITIVIICSSFNNGFEKSTKSKIFNDTVTTIIFKAKFIENIRGPFCQYGHNPERNKFETVVSFRDRQLIKKTIEVEYTGCEQHLFKPGEVYKIIAKPSPLRGGYQNITTYPEPDKIIVF